MTTTTGGIDSRCFGQFDSGDVILYTLTNEQRMSVEVSTLGASLVSVYVKDKQGDFANVVLNMPGADDYMVDSAYLGRTVGPVANRIANGQFSVNNEVFHLEQNDGDNCLHSGSNGLHNKIWHASTKQTAEGYALRLTVEHGHLEGGFPGHKVFEVTYFLSHDNVLTISFHAESDKTTPVSLTNHAYFNLAGGGNVLGHELLIRSRAITPVDAALIPTKDLMPVNNTPFDFEPSKSIGKELVSDHKQIELGSGYDHNFVLDSGGGPFAILSDAMSGRRMTVSTNMPGVQLYTGNFVQGTRTAKGNCPFEQYAGVCLEAQNFPDTPNWPDRPDFWMAPDKPYNAYIRYEFDVATS